MAKKLNELLTNLKENINYSIYFLEDVIKTSNDKEEIKIAKTTLKQINELDEKLFFAVYKFNTSNMLNLIEGEKEAVVEMKGINDKFYKLVDEYDNLLS